MLDGDKPNSPNRLPTVVLCGSLSPPRCISHPSLAHCLEKITEGGDTLRGIDEGRGGGGGESWNPQAKYLAAS